jgi:hypothetical protein
VTSSPNGVTRIGRDRQLFVDDYWIAASRDVERRLHSPERREVAIAGDKPWDNGVCSGGFMRDGDKYRAWYRCDHDPTMRLKRSGHDTAYAESTDGIHWEKPDLGIFEVNGSKDNNIVWMGPGANMVPFRDPNPEVPDEERYKAIVRGDSVVRALVSPDGLHWRLMQDEPILTDGPFDSVNLAFWDVWRGEYVAYTRGVAGKGAFKGGVRWIRRTTSKDFREWTPLELIDPGDTPFEHLYTSACVQYERAPGTYLMFPSRFEVDRVPDPDWTYDTGVSDVVFMSSRDGLHFDRSFMEAFIRPGLDQDNWHDRSIYVECGILQTSPEEISIYGMEHSHLDTMRIRRYGLRTDGFVSVQAGYAGGEFTTPPLEFERSHLAINFSTSAVGSVRVEIQDAEGRPIPGRALDECPEMFGDSIERVVSWNDGPSVGDLAGKPVRLRFAVKDADLYAFKFR